MRNMSNGKGTNDQAASAAAPSVATAFRILDFMAQDRLPVALTQIIDEVGLPKSTAFRVMGSLESVGAVNRDRITKRYSIGSKFSVYASAEPARDAVSNFLAEAGPLLRPLDETAQLGVLSGANVTFIACIDSTKPVRLVSYVGRTLPAHASATGKALLAHASPAQIEQVIDSGLPAMTQRTITSPDRLLAELALIRERGFATEEEESTLNLSCLSVPVQDPKGTVLHALTVCVPQSTLPEGRIDAIRTAAIEAGRAMSGASA